ncbi:uncharacterized protein CLUP02_12693 [Colletotrichum lupini]|uniref:Uncharacterized protein n=1 Tax=Colletotrichum lupini TaxID=145971 RepID=A0A9Q8T2V2_9PEZI|nr:uncharacterized protein CLUP02_12693 [Colletotrichum lupini]UQC87191.1 hypothetical protein CLUP02_12693 [Colletotrichum lupini]
MLPPKAKFVRELERNNSLTRKSTSISTTPSSKIFTHNLNYTFAAPSVPDMTYFARILHYQRYGHDGLACSGACSSHFTLPMYEKQGYMSPYQVRYTERPGSRGSLKSDTSFDVAGYRRELAAAGVRKRKWNTFWAVILALLIIFFGAGVLAPSTPLFQTITAKTSTSLCEGFSV